MDIQLSIALIQMLRSCSSILFSSDLFQTFILFAQLIRSHKRPALQQVHLSIRSPRTIMLIFLVLPYLIGLLFASPIAQSVSVFSASQNFLVPRASAQIGRAHPLRRRSRLERRVTRLPFRADDPRPHEWALPAPSNPTTAEPQGPHLPTVLERPESNPAASMQEFGLQSAGHGSGSAVPHALTDTQEQVRNQGWHKGRKYRARNERLHEKAGGREMSAWERYLNGKHHRQHARLEKNTRKKVEEHDPVKLEEARRRHESQSADINAGMTGGAIGSSLNFF